MNTAVRWAATLVLFMLISGLQLHLNDAAATPGPVNPGRLSPFVAECANTDDAGQHGADIVVMGPGGDFAGATVIHDAAAKPASTGILVLGPQGEFLAKAGEQPELLLAEVDLGRSEDVRRIWPFLRDRRIDAYGDLLKRYRD